MLGRSVRGSSRARSSPAAIVWSRCPVAAHDGARQAPFHNELRIARQVSHKNVCRLRAVPNALQNAMLVALVFVVRSAISGRRWVGASTAIVLLF